MLCHREIRKESGAIQRLAALPKDAKPFPQSRIYKLPDFVVFSHARHKSAHIDCSQCHGPVEQRDILIRELPLKMKMCVDCHKSHDATVVCNACHELNQ
jgi:hypothetical protein